MIAALRAMVWLRLRLLKNELRSAKSRDWLEKLSRIGAVLTPTNVYSGLKIGWSFNLSITALLITWLLGA